MPNIFFNVWEKTGEISLNTFLHSSWERGRVRMIFLPDLNGDVNQII